jgi:putative membrane protein
VLFRVVVRLVVLAAIFGLVAWILPGIDVHGGFGSLLWIALLFAIVNATIGTILRLLSIPLIVITLGLILLLINALLIAITAGLSDHLDCDSFGSAVLAGALVAVFGWFGELLLPLRRHA